MHGTSSVWLVLAMGVGSSIIPGATPAGAEDASLWTQRSIFDTKGGPKESLRETGISIDFWLTSFGQGILAGHGETGIEWGTKGDLIAGFNGEKLGLWPGLFVNLHYEFVWGEDANFQGDGSIIPVNTVLAFPRLGDADQDLSISVTQAFGPRALVSVGKFNMLDAASKTPIMGGGGLTTFMNTALAAPISGVTPLRVAKDQPAVIFGGVIVTMEGESPTYAEAVVIRDGMIIFVGDKQQALIEAGARLPDRARRSARKTSDPLARSGNISVEWQATWEMSG